MKDALVLINELKEKQLIKDYAIGGAIGVLKWVEPFFTRDLDIFIIPNKEYKKELINLTPLYEYLQGKGASWKGRWLVIGGVPVDLIPVDPLEREAVENAEETEYGGVKTKVLTAEYLIALLLRAGRDKDKRKIEMLLGQARIDKEKLHNLLQKYRLSKKYVKFQKRG